MKVLMIESNPAGISGIKRAIKAGHEVVFVTVDPDFYKKTNPEAESVFADPACQVIHNKDIFEIKNLIRLIDEINTKHKIDGVTTYSEYHVIHTAQVASYLKLPGLSIEGAKNARFKHRTREKLVNSDIPQPKFIHVSKQDDIEKAVKEIGFPCILKPSDGTAGLNVVFINNQNDLFKYLENIRTVNDYGRGVLRSNDILIEEYVTGEIVSVESCVLRKNEVINLGITDRIIKGFPYFIEMGCAYFADHPLRDKLFELNTKILNELDIDFGFIHTEFILSPQGPVLCEVNGRLVGGAVPQLMTVSSGVDPFLEVINLALGKKPQLPFPTEKIACARWFGSPVVGTLNKVNLNDMSLQPGFVESIMYKKEGERVAKLSQSNFDWLGHVIFAADSREEAVRRAEQALSKISLDLNIDPVH